MSALDRARARVVSGPLGRGTGFAIDFAVALAQGIKNKARTRRS